jgi:hypothetical protein
MVDSNKILSDERWKELFHGLDLAERAREQRVRVPEFYAFPIDLESLEDSCDFYEWRVGYPVRCVASNGRPAFPQFAERIELRVNQSVVVSLTRDLYNEKRGSFGWAPAFEDHNGTVTVFFAGTGAMYDVAVDGMRVRSFGTLLADFPSTHKYIELPPTGGVWLTPLCGYLLLPRLPFGVAPVKAAQS